MINQFRTENPWTILIDGTSRAGIEAVLLSIIRLGFSTVQGAGLQAAWSVYQAENGVTFP